MVNKFIINWNKNYEYTAFIGLVRINFRKCKIYLIYHCCVIFNNLPKILFVKI